MGITGTKAVIRYWNPQKPNEIGYCTIAKFYEHQTILPNGDLSAGFKFTQRITQTGNEKSFSEVLQLNYQDHPHLTSPPITIRLRLLHKRQTTHLRIQCMGLCH